MPTVFEDLSVELIHEILLYFQYHEIWNMFSSLNSRVTIIINNMLFMPIYLGYNAMSIATTELYYRHLSKPNVSNSLISLCVSNEFAFDNGLWLASHLSSFINLRCLSLIDIKRCTFESILNSASPMSSVNVFNVQFLRSICARYTFFGVPEGAYYDRVFHLFPSLRVCHLRFERDIDDTVDNKFVLPSDRPFMLVHTSLPNLQSLEIKCSIYFLSHLLEHLPQLEQLNYRRTDVWLPQEHPLRNDYNLRTIPINKRLAPNLRHLIIYWDRVITLKSFTEFFERDLLISLMKFKLCAETDSPHFLCNLLSTLSSQCSYSFYVDWFVESTVALPETSKILSDTCEQLKGLIPIDFELSIVSLDNIHHTYLMGAGTIPIMNKCLCINSYLDKRMVIRQNQWSHNTHASNIQFYRCNEIMMSEHYDEINDKFISSSPPIVPWHQITSVHIPQPFDSTLLHRLISQVTNIRKLQLEYLNGDRFEPRLREKTLVSIINDVSLCGILMANGLRQLSLSTQEAFYILNWVEIANLIVERLSLLEIMELDGFSYQLIEMTPVLINGLSKLNFLTFIGNLREGKINEKKLHDLQNSIIRPFRTEVPDATIDDQTILIWL